MIKIKIGQVSLSAYPKDKDQEKILKENFPALEKKIVRILQDAEKEILDEFITLLTTTATKSKNGKLVPFLACADLLEDTRN